MHFTRLLTLALAGGLFVAPAIAQHAPAPGAGTLSLAWGEEYEFPKGSSDIGFFGDSEHGYVQVSHREHRKLTFQRFDKELKLSTEREIDLEEMPNDYESEMITELGGKYYWIFSTYQKKDKQESVYRQELDLENGSFKGAAVQIMQMDKIATGWLFGGHKYKFYTSFDNSKLLVEYRHRPEFRNDRKNTDVIGVQIFDQDLKKIWNADLRMPYTEAMMDNLDFQVDSRGNVYTVATVYEDGSRSHNGYRDGHLEIMRWSPGVELPVQVPVRFNEKYIRNAILSEAGDHSILVSGYYSNKKGASSDGAYLLRLDEDAADLKEINKGLYEFPVSLMKEYESSRTRRRMERKDQKDNAEVDNLVMRKVVTYPNGAVDLIGEEAFVITTTYSNGKSTYTTTTYYYNDIFLSHIGPDGKLQWSKKIPKSQMGKTPSGVAAYFNYNTGGLSFKHYNYGGDSYFFFLDRESNLGLARDEAPDAFVDGKRALLVAVKVAPDGSMQKSEVMNLRDEDVSLRISNFHDVGSNQIMGRAMMGRRSSKPAVITFN
jgi:hypothetical protein